MQHYRNGERGITIIELMIAMSISVAALAGSMQLWSRFEKSAAAQRSIQDAKVEVDVLNVLLKKVWDYRRRDGTPGVPSTGFYLRLSNNQPCTSNCPKFISYVKRTINGVSVTDEVTVTSECLRINNTPFGRLLRDVDFSAQMNGTCLRCNRGEVPVVSVTGYVMGTTRQSLGSENRRLPSNLLDLDKARLNSALGTQVCFSQAAASSPLSIDMRTLVLRPNETTLQSYQKTQVFAVDNFAKIKLEQAP